ncbi:AbrB family transcriptional regulator, partial [Nguyenibacter vanlangensis]
MQWTMLGVLTVAVVCPLTMLHLPAALLMGAIGAGILQALLEGSVRVAPLPFALAQGIVGCMIGRGLRPSILHEVARNWPLFLGGVLFAIVAGIVLGWMLMRLRVLPGTTALWGISPGAATAMVLMADAFGADSRLVGFMQYMRVLCVALTASLVARWWGVDMGHRPPVIWFPPLPVPQFAVTLGLIGGGVVLARRLAVPAGALLLPLALGVAAQDGGGL